MADVIIAKNITSGPAVDVPIGQLSVPDAKVPASSQVTLTDWNTIDEITVDDQLRDHIENDKILLIVNGVELTKAQSLNIVTPAVSEETTSSQVLKGSGGTINAGQAVRITGYNAVAELTEVELTDASAAATMAAVGIASEEITDSTPGSMVILGQLIGQNTSAWSVGDDLYVSETPGALTTTPPTGAALIQKVAEVARSHVTAGVLQVFATGRPNALPNVPQTKFWMGDSSGVAQPTVVNDLAADGSPDGAADYVMTWDATASLHKKVFLDNLPGGGGGSDFGKDADDVESLGESSTTSSSFQDKLVLTVSGFTGRGRIGWSAIISNDGDTSVYRVRNTTDNNTLWETAEKIGNANDVEREISGFAYVDFAGSAKTFKLQFRDEDGGHTAKIKTARMDYWRVS